MAKKLKTLEDGRPDGRGRSPNTLAAVVPHHFKPGNKVQLLKKINEVSDDEDFRRLVIKVAKQGGSAWLKTLKKEEPDIFARLVAMSYKGEEPTSKDDKVFNINIGGLPISEAERKALGDCNKVGEQAVCPVGEADESIDQPQ